MIKSKKAIYIISALFVAIEGILLIIVQTKGGVHKDNAKFLVALTACAFCALMLRWHKREILTQLALVFTVFADMFFIYLKPNREAAMTLFSAAQLCYFLRLYFNHKSKRARLAHAICRAVISAAALALTAVVLRERTDALSLLSLFYYANLIMNIVVAFTQKDISLLFAVGLLLFACCDALIGIAAADELYFSLPWVRAMNSLGINFAWLFYVPSQSLIALSLVGPRLTNARLAAASQEQDGNASAADADEQKE